MTPDKAAATEEKEPGASTDSPGEPFPHFTIVPNPSESLTSAVTSSTSPQSPTLHHALSLLESLPLTEMLDSPSTPLKISLKGLHTFTPTSPQTRVLFAKPHDPTDRLLPFATKVLQAFIDAGLVEPRPQAPQTRTNGTDDKSESESKSESLILHATIVNMTYHKSKSKPQQQHRHRRSRRTPPPPNKIPHAQISNYFNTEAGGLLDSDDHEFIWADGIDVDRVCICEMGVKKIEKEGWDEEEEEEEEEKVEWGYRRVGEKKVT
ncbi:hypothetical protein UCRPC4_g03362 [Phaeomoniella chlamydospora]|uniref:A-kinase anchor protein 7-like phosphoesterase domain-containing protein n=1 Tax=Phaeomoniella chlamydospora TaxID=158046 RepID=A0A0G2EIF9_PHACM|nr:hypothetical protein UCRPC4_g03362 [Phaeomoniella chlamydospora]